jgi:putative RNA 2'-phosphotransferase
LTPSASDLSRVMSHALRHQPWIYELELDEGGWVSLDMLLTSFRRLGPGWERLDRSDVQRMIDGASKRRHEIAGDRVRALYGHSVPSRLLKDRAEPPSQLFHGTDHAAWQAIKAEGIRPMGRQFVHLSVDVPTAKEVGLRKSRLPIVLVVDAQAAYLEGVPFFAGNEAVWLADSVPAKFVVEVT